jgi:hypothetical protein
MLIDPNALADVFIKHVHTLRSAPFVCSAPTAMEGWFRAETVPALEDLKIKRQSIESRFNYPGTLEQADLSVKVDDQLVVFEFMHLVSRKDRKKIKRFPVQLDRLERIVLNNVVYEAIAFLTFNGYSENRQRSLLDSFFRSRRWQQTGPQRVLKDNPLMLVIAGLSKQLKTSNEVKVL